MPRLFAQKLRALRHVHNLSQETVAQCLGIGANTRISQLEGREADGRAAPSLALVVQIASLFHVSTDYLLRDTIPLEPLPLSTFSPFVEQITVSEPFSTKLRELREQHKLTQLELAHRLGLARQAYISNLESGRKAPSLDLVVRIADLFKVKTDDLLQGITHDR